MKTKNPSLQGLTAGDLMSPEILFVRTRSSMREAAQLFAKARISGAPVVDDDGRCVGVLSATDFFSGVVKENLEFDPQHLVGEHMTADPVTVKPSTPLGTLARMMLDADIHRLIVVDEDNRPIGVVSSTDLMAALATPTEDMS